MSRINTRILRVPGVSGQIDERPMGSFMAPMEAAGEALADLGDLGQQIAVKEQGLQDRILASDLESELRESSMRANEAAANAKSIEELDGIQRGFDADFESIQQRADGIQGEEGKANFANRASLLGGRTALGLTSLKVNAEVSKAKLQRKDEAGRLLAEGMSSGDIDGAIAQVEALYEGGVGTLDSEWDDIDAEITSIVGGAQHTNWQIKVDEGEVGAKEVLSAKHLTEGARRSLLSQIAGRKGREEGLAERQALSDISNKVTLLPDHPDGIPAGLESLRAELTEFYGDGAPEVQIAYQQAVESAYTELLDRSASIPDVADREDSLDSLEGEIRLASEGSQTGAEKKVYDRALLGIQQLRYQMVRTTEKDRAEQLKQMHDQINLGIMEAKVNGYLKADGTQMDAKEFEDMMLRAAGIEGLDANGAWDSDNKIVRENFISAKELILRQKLAYKEMTRTPFERTYEAALAGDIRAMDSLSMQAWLGASDDEAFEESLASGEKDSAYGKVIHASAKTGVAPSHIRDWVLSHDNMAEAARKWLAQPDRGFLHFDKGGLDEKDAIKLHDFTRATLAVRSGSVSMEDIDGLFSDKEESRVAIGESARAELEKDDLRNFLKNWREGLLEKSDFSRRKEVGDEKAYLEEMASKLVSDGFFKTEDEAAVAIANGKSRDMENMAMLFLQKPGNEAGLAAFLGESTDPVGWEIANSAFRAAAGAVFGNQGHNYFTPRSPGEYRPTDFSPPTAYGLVSGRGKSPAINLAKSDKAVMEGSSAWTPVMVDLYDAIREAYPGAIEDDVQWTKIFGKENAKGADALRDVIRSADGARTFSTEESMVAGWIQSNDFKSKTPREIKATIAHKHEQLPSEKLRWGSRMKLPPESSVNAGSLMRLIKSGMVTISKGPIANEQETRVWNEGVDRLRPAGYKVDNSDFVYKVRFTIQTSSGPVVIDRMPSPMNLIYDARASQESGIYMKEIGPDYRKKGLDVVGTMPGKTYRSKKASDSPRDYPEEQSALDIAQDYLNRTGSGKTSIWGESKNEGLVPYRRLDNE